MSEENKNTNNKPKDNDPNSWKNRERGAAWNWPDDQNPDKMSIVIKNSEGKDIKFVALKNSFKSDKKHPYWKIFIDNQDYKTKNPVAKTEPKKKVIEAKSTELPESDDPF